MVCWEYPASFSSFFMETGLLFPILFFLLTTFIEY